MAVKSDMLKHAGNVAWHFLVCKVFGVEHAIDFIGLVTDAALEKIFQWDVIAAMLAFIRARLLQSWCPQGPTAVSIPTG